LARASASRAALFVFQDHNLVLGEDMIYMINFNSH